MLKKIYNNYILKKRGNYNKKLQSKLKNKEFSLITNNCCGGVIYNRLGCRFLTPTINLWIDNEDYIIFCQNLTEFLESDNLVEVLGNYDYPVGELSCSKGTIKIYFQHYKTFEEAKQKWIERCKRVNLNNLFFIFEEEFCDKKSINEFFKLDYKNKKVLTMQKENKLADCFIRYPKKYVHGAMLFWKSMLSAQKYIDDFDYVSFLNGDND